MKEDLIDNFRQLITANLNKENVPFSADGMPIEPTRLLNGRGGWAPDFSDVNVDLYPPLLYVTLYCKYCDQDIKQIATELGSLLPNHPVLIQDRSVRPAVIRLQQGIVPEEIIISESGLKYYLNPLRGQNPGFFSDMRIGRSYISSTINRMSEPADQNIKVLNLFAYTCSLSVVALAAGAKKVINIDKNRRSLDIGRKNHLLNNESISGGYHNQAMMLPHDIFKSIGKLKKEGLYDMIIADPPPSQKGSFMMLKDYPRLLRRLPEMLKPGGELFLTQNGPGWSWADFESMLKVTLPEFNILNRINPPEDFAPAEEGRGLKIIIMKKDK